MARALVEGRQRTRRLRKIQIHCEDALGQAVMEFAAEATPLFVLQLQQARGKLMERLFGLFALGDVRKRVDYCGNGSVRPKLWHGASQCPENFARVLAAPADHFILNRLLRFYCARSRPHRKWNLGSVFAN